MFKENKEFWLYFLGIIILFFLLYSLLRNGFEGSSLIFSSFPFNLVEGQRQLFAEPDYKIETDKDYVATLLTNKGNVFVDLYESAAPNTVGNFIYLANSGYYESLPFHRFIPGLLIQGGSSTSKNSDSNDDKFGGPGYTIKDEINWDSLDYSAAKKLELSELGYKSAVGIDSVKMKKYSLAMASNGPDTGGAQFVIILADSNDTRLVDLEGKLTVFGHVIGGFNVLDSIAAKQTDDDSESIEPEDFILKDVVIKIKE